MAVASYPIVWGKKVAAVLFVAFDAEAGRDTLDLLEIAAGMMASKSRILELENSLRSRSTQLSVILELNKAMRTAQDVKSIYYILLDMTVNLVQGKFTCLIFKQSNHSAIELLSRGVSTEKAAAYGRELTERYFTEGADLKDNQSRSIVREQGEARVIECPLFCTESICAVLAFEVGEEQETEQLQQILSVLTLLGSTVLQRIAHETLADCTREIEWVHSLTEYWNREKYGRMMELEQIALAFAETMRLKEEMQHNIKQASILSLYDEDFVSAFFPVLDTYVLQGIHDYRALTMLSSGGNSTTTASKEYNVMGQILALADHYLGNKDVQVEKMDQVLRGQFESFVLRKDTHSQQISISKRSVELTEPLTTREKEVLSMLVNGFGNKEIANQLYISEHTVKNHLTKIFQKLGVNDRSQAIAFAYRYLQ